MPPLAGRITQLKVKLGQRVESGQPLLVLNSSDLATAYADYDRAKVISALTLKNRDRQRSLAKFGGAAIKDQQQAEADYVTAEVELRRAETRLKQIGVSAETTDRSRTVTVTAPVSGSVIDLAAAPGAFWNDPGAALMTVADLTTVWVAANVPEKDTSVVANGQRVDVVFAAYPAEVFKGQVLFVSDVLELGHAPHQSPHCFPESRHAIEAKHVCQCQLLHADAENASDPDDGPDLEERLRSGIRRGRAMDLRSAPH